MKTQIITTIIVGLACFTLGFLARPVEFALPYAFPKVDAAKFAKAERAALFTQAYNLVEFRDAGGIAGALFTTGADFNLRATSFNLWLESLPSETRGGVEPLPLLVRR